MTCFRREDESEIEKERVGIIQKKYENKRTSKRRQTSSRVEDD